MNQSDQSCSEFADRIDILRIDGVGSFRLFLGDRLTLTGPQARPASDAVSILGPLSREHAAIDRTPGGYRLTPLRGTVEWNSSQGAGNSGEPALSRTAGWLSPQSVVGLGNELTLRLRIDSPLSQTAVVELTPTARWKESIDGIVLIDRLLILGPGPQANIRCPHWPETAAVVIQGNRLRIRCPIGSDRTEPAEFRDLELGENRYLNINDMGLYLDSQPCG